MTTKDDTIEEIADMLDTMSTAESFQILRKLNTGDLVALNIAIRKYGEKVLAQAFAESTNDD